MQGLNMHGIRWKRAFRLLLATGMKRREALTYIAAARQRLASSKGSQAVHRARRNGLV